MRTNRRFVKVLAGLALAATALTGCGTGNDGRDSSVVSEEALQDWSGDPHAAADQMEAAGGGMPADVAQVEQAIIVTGDASVKVDVPSEAVEVFTARVEELGGLISSSEVSQSGSTPSASVTARIPADKYQELVDSLADIGEVLRSSSSSEDVGQDLADIDARIAALETSIERLTTLIEEATTTADLLQAEEMLTYRQAELDSLRGQAEYLRDQVSMSTLSVYFTTTTSQPGPQGSLAEGWELFLSSIINMFYTLMVLLPWLILAAIVLIPLLKLRSNRRRRQNEKVAAAVADSQATRSVPAAAPAEEASASDRLVDDAAERGRIVSEAAEEETVDGVPEPGEEPRTR